MHAALPLLRKTDFSAVWRKTLDTLQMNLGYKCNQTCQHCHVNAGPNRKEMMDRETIDLILQVMRERHLSTLDLAGGAPEMNPYFRYLVEEARKQDVRVVDRCNLTILSEPGYEELAEFLAEHNVHIVASLPCYSQENVDKQRGDGAFDKSIAALQSLNALRYGQNRRLLLSLVYNP